MVSNFTLECKFDSSVEDLMFLIDIAACSQSCSLVLLQL